MADFEDGGRGHASRNVGQLLEAGKWKEMNVPQFVNLGIPLTGCRAGGKLFNLSKLPFSRL